MQSDDFRGLVLENTLTKRKELFRSRNAGVVKIFTCGPSVYRRPHIGNYRTFLYEDVLVRYLEYLGYTVDRAINFTDVEDKTIAAAGEEHTGVQELTEPVVKRFHEETTLLGIKLPREIPRSSTSVKEAVAIIQTLIEKGHAYRHQGNVYFDPLTYDGFGEIYGLDMSRWPKKKVRFSQDTYPGQRWNLGDFILWHGYKDDDTIHWDTEIGPGRPAWNVQDPAMIAQTLGFELDIHCGGIDNLWRHHDYNRAIMESASETELAHYWLHGEHLIVDGDKMSKSRGNVIYPEMLIERGCDGRHIRYLLIYGHYRDKLNVTDTLMEQRCEEIEEIQTDVKEIMGNLGKASGKKASKPNPRAEEIANELIPLFEHQMNDDLNVKGAIDNIHQALNELARVRKNGIPKQGRETAVNAVKRIDGVLGVILER